MEKELSKSQVYLMAIAAGVSVANIYYNQPILKDIANYYHKEEAAVGSISMLTQIGYGLGLFFLIPLGDKMNRKKLIITLFSLLILSLLGMVFAPSITMVQVLSVLIGILSVTPQIMIPMAAQINHRTRGKTVGTILSGLLIGILAARVLSGWVAEISAWKTVYGISAILCLVTLLLLVKTLPNIPNSFEGNYFSLLGSALKQFTRFGHLREAALMGAALFGVFCSFWTTLTFHLSGEPFNYSSEQIGLFGIVAIVGAMMAPIVGTLTDKGKTRLALVICAILCLVSAVLIKLFPTSLLFFIIAIILMDIGVQGAQVANSARIYGLDKNAGSRINTIYMTSYFLGGALGTAAGLFCWKNGGWDMVTNQMILWSIIGLLVVVIGGYFLKNKKKGV